MIKCNVTVCGIISRDAVIRNSKEGKPFVNLTVQANVQGKNGQGGTLELSVSKDGTPEEVAGLRTGMRVKVTGILIPKHRGERIYFNLSADSIVPVGAEEAHSLNGQLAFRGKVGKTIEDRADRSGKPFTVFSAFSTEKVNDGFEYLWVKFFCFGKPREEWLQPGCRIEARGEMELSFYNGKAEITCRPEVLAPYTPNPANCNN